MRLAHPGLALLWLLLACGLNWLARTVAVIRCRKHGIQVRLSRGFCLRCRDCLAEAAVAECRRREQARRPELEQVVTQLVAEMLQEEAQKTR